MKNLFLIPVLLIAFVLMTSCGGNQNGGSGDGTDSTQKINQTAENLKAAFRAEITAASKYEKFSEKAREEGQPKIAILFMAVAKAENVHAENHAKVLSEMGISTQDMKAYDFEVKTTVENLQTGKDEELADAEKMYPAFLAQAKSDNNKKAEKSLNWAMETEKKHVQYFQTAMDALKAGNTKNLPSEYFVCPKCGFTYHTTDVEDECELCSTEKEKYLVFK